MNPLWSVRTWIVKRFDNLIRYFLGKMYLIKEQCLIAELVKSAVKNAAVEKTA